MIGSLLQKPFREKLGLVGAPYFAQTGDFLDYAWSYSTNQYGRISSFERPVQEKELTLTVKGGSHKGYRDALEQFYRTVEVDIAALQPGEAVRGRDLPAVLYLWVHKGRVGRRRQYGRPDREGGGDRLPILDQGIDLPVPGTQG